MKIIGVELRIGVVGGNVGSRMFEAKLWPVEVEYPDALCYGAMNLEPAVEVTVHTSNGDRTVTQQLPFRKPPPSGESWWDHAGKITEKQIRAALEELERRVARV